MMSIMRKFALPLALIASLLASPARAEPDTVSVMLDRATILRLPTKVATIVIGNPAVADGSLQTGGLLVVTGKGYGTTNLLALDRQGDTLAEYTVNVSGPADDNKVVVYRGVERETWSCAPKCEHAVVLGDSATYFNAASGQIVSRNATAGGRHK
jgi:Flp pilus assembly secretin CpaC